MLHGATRPGPNHAAIVRLAAALAGAGGDVLVPEVPAWRRLDLDPAPARRALDLAVRHLCADPQVRPGGVVLAGLSFGCPQALIAGAELAAEGLVRGVLGYGGYHSLEGAIRFGLTGQFEWQERVEYLRPDPYGRWVVASNYLHRIPGLEHAEDVSRALRRLAAMAGDRGFMAWQPASDPYKAKVMAAVSPANHRLFRVFAPNADREPDPDRARELAPLLVDAARSVHPDLELGRGLGPLGVGIPSDGGAGIASHGAASIPGRGGAGIPGERATGIPRRHGSGSPGPPAPLASALPPVHLIHGRRDRLIPFTETLALERRLRAGAQVSATVTGLLEHSRGLAGRVPQLPEAVRFVKALRGVMALH